MKNTKDARSRRSPARHCSQFWVIDTDSPGEHERSRTAIGPFPSQNAAEKWLREDAKDTFLSADNELRSQETWAAPMIIVEETKTVRQVPTVKVTVRLETVDTANDQEEPRHE